MKVAVAPVETISTPDSFSACANCAKPSLFETLIRALLIVVSLILFLEPLLKSCFEPSQMALKIVLVYRLMCLQTHKLNFLEFFFA